MTPIKTIVFMFGLLIMAFFFFTQTVGYAKKRNTYFETLQESLIKDGFDKHTIIRLYSHPKVYFETKKASLFLFHREAVLNYDHFTSPGNIQKSRKYMAKHKPDLLRAERTYGVNKEIITAIILIETKLGTRLGGPSVLNMLSTVASLSDPDVRNMFWGKVSKSNKLTKKKFENWVGRKSKWAYNELKAFLTYTTREKMDPSRIYGSYAGAMGIPQFMPSNILAFAKDGNNDGRVDLFNHADAIMSVATYLKHYGWHSGIKRKRAVNVIYRYNHSRPYVDAVLKVASLLKT
ncbi:MAG: lytic murein transglycosylase [Deltaproteobacteria bacterium]|nr:lytic murein transglycosylase [Deltaproteobacteria bacterium]MBW1957739.1 lytic murein transglycosylase [Deltaproteobacteria bacterium]MBW2014221.1 lytic murein transglycosylase [Deltaproteobacteria bacterium]MBW2089475.1 lytic murein transglycosylase [Deltaproteobacteria bacterium]